jgi:23S rRNA (adenine2503-C2)-methyltransferase
MKALQGLSFAGLEEALAAEGIKPVHAAAVWRALYRELIPESGWGVEQCGPAAVRNWLAGRRTAEPVVEAETASQDGQTRKFLLRLRDGAAIETVLMGYPGRHTGCLSTQAGCAMGCVFCATGQRGFTRHLDSAEIVIQAVHLQRVLRDSGGTGLRNVVLMGMGEPLHNYDAVMGALEILTDTRGLNLGPSRMTVSTVGHVPGIRRMAEERRPYHLAVSLHGARQEDRVALVPVAAKWPIDELIDACRFYARTTGRKIFFEWTLIAGKNDGAEQATALTRLLEGVPAHVNLIPLNPTDGYVGGPTGRGDAVIFQQILGNAGIPSTIRQRRGIDVAAGCGQLAQKL